MEFGVWDRGLTRVTKGGGTISIALRKCPRSHRVLISGHDIDLAVWSAIIPDIGMFTNI